MVWCRSRSRGGGGSRRSTYSSSYSSSIKFILLWGGRDLDQNGRLPRRAVLRYDVPVFGVAGDRRWVRAVLVSPATDADSRSSNPVMTVVLDENP